MQRERNVAVARRLDVGERVGTTGQREALHSDESLILVVQVILDSLEELIGAVGETQNILHRKVRVLGDLGNVDLFFSQVPHQIDEATVDRDLFFLIVVARELGGLGGVVNRDVAGHGVRLDLDLAPLSDRTQNAFGQTLKGPLE